MDEYGQNVQFNATHYSTHLRASMGSVSGLRGERMAQRAIEDLGFSAVNANILFRAQCANIDLVAFGKTRAAYIQVKLSSRPAGKDAVLVDGSPWTSDQLLKNAPVYNRHTDAMQAEFVVIVDCAGAGVADYYVVPPAALTKIARSVGRAFLGRPKRDGRTRMMFRKEVPRLKLKPYLNAWHLLGLSQT
jgi:Holliday junction resolvase-like predicted endonuclease